ncbi:phosphoenolpyruvate--protein phosphotransferase [bacterium]|nr:phosphoenolpyruvate--protein phosphotransferase [bacterium]
MKNQKMAILEGIGVSDGIILARPFIINRAELIVKESKLGKKEAEAEINRFLEAIELSKEQLRKVRAAMAKTTGEKSAQIIDAQLVFLEDTSMINEITGQIRSELKNPEFILDRKMKETISRLEKVNNQYLRDRTHDFQDVFRRVTANLLGFKREILKKPEGEYILVIDHLAPSETTQVFHEGFCGIVTEMGGKTSHVAIMAKTMEIPTVLGVVDATRQVPPEGILIVDGSRGKVVVNPPSPLIKKYEEYQKKLGLQRREFSKLKPLIPKALDGHRITLSANIELPEEIRAVNKYNAEGVGLFRTEVIYTTQEESPTEEEQYQIYRQLAQDVKPHSAIIRTFDIGGDKFSSHFDHSFEPNPFLGWRAIRIGLTHPELLKIQMRAILRASVLKNLKMMFPMISTLDEIYEVKKLLDETKDELRAKGQLFDEKIQIGIMIEVPSAALIARELAKHVDFFSIGTNDLTQYIMAADRGNARVSYLYQSYNPAVLKLIQQVVVAGHFEGIWVGLCGELAGDPRATIMLLGMGLDEFSTNPISVPAVKKIIRSVNFSDAQLVAEEIRRFTTEKEMIEFLDRKNKELLPAEILDNPLFSPIKVADLV